MDDEKAKPDDPAQSQRFMDMAHEVGANGADDRIERTFASLSTSSPTKKKTNLRPKEKKSD